MVPLDRRRFRANQEQAMQSVSQETPCNPRLVQYLIENCPLQLEFSMTVIASLIALRGISELSKRKCQAEVQLSFSHLKCQIFLCLY